MVVPYVAPLGGRRLGDCVAADLGGAGAARAAARGASRCQQKRVSAPHRCPRAFQWITAGRGPRPKGAAAHLQFRRACDDRGSDGGWPGRIPIGRRSVAAWWRLHPADRCLQRPLDTARWCTHCPHLRGVATWQPDRAWNDRWGLRRRRGGCSTRAATPRRRHASGGDGGFARDCSCAASQRSGRLDRGDCGTRPGRLYRGACRPRPAHPYRPSQSLGQRGSDAAVSGRLVGGGSRAALSCGMAPPGWRVGSGTAVVLDRKARHARRAVRGHCSRVHGDLAVQSSGVQWLASDRSAPAIVQSVLRASATRALEWSSGDRPDRTARRCAPPVRHRGSTRPSGWDAHARPRRGARRQQRAVRVRGLHG